MRGRAAVFICKKCGEDDRSMRHHKSMYCVMCHDNAMKQERIDFQTSRIRSRGEKHWDMMLAAKWLAVQL